MNPIKPSLKTESLPLALIAVALVSSFYFYANFPDQVPIHWNMAGEVDGYGSKLMGAFLFPLLIVFMYLMFLFIPYLDPKKDRYEQFRRPYHIFKAFIISFFLIMYFVSGLNALGYQVPVEIWTPIMVGVLFVAIGNYLSKIKPNWFMGIRTPWTLSSEENWNKTHRLAAKLFVLGGLGMMLLPFIGDAVKIILFVAIILLLGFVPLAYSLILFLRDKNGKNNQQG